MRVKTKVRRLPSVYRPYEGALQVYFVYISCRFAIAVLAATSTTYEGALIAKTHHDKYHRGFERSRE